MRARFEIDGGVSVLTPRSSAYDSSALALRSTRGCAIPFAVWQVIYFGTMVPSNEKRNMPFHFTRQRLRPQRDEACAHMRTRVRAEACAARVHHHIVHERDRWCTSGACARACLAFAADASGALMPVLCVALSHAYGIDGCRLTIRRTRAQVTCKIF